MPIPEHPDRAIAPTAYGHDLDLMNAVLSPLTPDAPALTVAPVALDNGVLFGLEPETPASSFRLQVLRAWIEARGSCPDEIAGHA